MNWRAFLALSLSLLLAACNAAGSGNAPSTPTAAKPQASTNTAKAPPAGPPPAPRPGSAKAGASTGTLDELVGLDEDGVHKLLGTPAGVRSEGAARILSYKAGTCALDVILFLDVKGGDLRVLSYELDSGSPRPAKARACYGELRNAR